jgi:zinc-finger of transposase IS204/IS1001/IS1096/IS1165/Helix-turn-helix domain of transposase family ISL3
VIFNLPGYRVVEAVDLPLRGRRVKVQPVDLDDGCPGCGVVSSRVHAWVEQRVRDIPHAGQVVVVVVGKPRLICVEPACGRRTFTPTTEELPARARCTTRLKTALLDAVIDSGRAVWEVAADLRVAWWTVQAVPSTSSRAQPISWPHSATVGPLRSPPACSAKSAGPVGDSARTSPNATRRRCLSRARSTLASGRPPGTMPSSVRKRGWPVAT